MMKNMSEHTIQQNSKDKIKHYIFDMRGHYIDEMDPKLYKKTKKDEIVYKIKCHHDELRAKKLKRVLNSTL